MGKDSANNILFLLGAISNIIVIGIAAYFLATHYLVLPDYILIANWINVLAIFLLALAVFAIYRETENYIPLIAMILTFITAIIGSLQLLGILVGGIELTWAIWIFSLITTLLIGFVFWMTREQIGSFAALTGIITMIWAIIRLILRVLDYGLGPSIYDQLWFVGTIVISLFAAIYFILAYRS
jgi:hypothetical protein